MARISLNVPDRTYNFLRQLARERGVTQTNVIIEALDVEAWIFRPNPDPEISLIIERDSVSIEIRVRVVDLRKTK